VSRLGRECDIKEMRGRGAGEKRWGGWGGKRGRVVGEVEGVGVEGRGGGDWAGVGGGGVTK